jgi:AP2-like factor (ANT lineage)
MGAPCVPSGGAAGTAAAQHRPHLEGQGGWLTNEAGRGSISRYIGVSWDKRSSSWKANLYDPQTQRAQYVGSYASEVDAARAYDCAAVQAHGPGAKRNLPGEDTSEPPVSLGEERRERKTSLFVGVRWNKANWSATLYDPQTKRGQYIGSYASEEDAARAYDRAAVQAHGPGAERNFPPASTDTNRVSEGDGDISLAALVRSLGESTSVHTIRCVRVLRLPCCPPR